MYRLIVFDWDGTLMDSSAQIVSCMQQAMAEAGLPSMPDDRVQQVIGLGLDEAVRGLLPDHDDQVVDGVADAYRKHWLSSPPGLSQFFPGVEELLLALYRCGVPLAIATGKSRRGLDKQLAETGVRHYFKTSCCADESLSKPAPDMLLEIMQQASVTPEQVLMVGDTTFDMQMAQSAQVDRVAVTYGVHNRGQLIPYTPVSIVDTSEELCSWFEINILQSHSQMDPRKVNGR